MMDLPDYISTPYHVVNLDKLINNISVLSSLKDRAKCKILYALKCFPNDLLFQYTRIVLDGVCASGIFEARLGKEKYGKEVHSFTSACSESNIDELSMFSDYLAFNSIQHWTNFKDRAYRNGCSVGLRVNPGYSEIENYNINPCHKYSRFGVTPSDLNKTDIENLDFILVHNMCGQFEDTFERSLSVFVEKFQDYIGIVKHINFGGGQLFTHKKYNINAIAKLISDFQEIYGVTVYIEPGEAIMIDTSFLITSVVDIIDNGIKTAILDASAVCHMPDTVFSKYKCKIHNSVPESQSAQTYRLAGISCYAGDIFGDFSFSRPLQIEDKIVIYDSLNYSSVKSSMFNGISYPSIVLFSHYGGYSLVKSYNYETYLSII